MGLFTTLILSHNHALSDKEVKKEVGMANMVLNVHRNRTPY